MQRWLSCCKARLLVVYVTLPSLERSRLWRVPIGEFVERLVLGGPYSVQS
jgi:hypothetical protein